MKSKISQTTDVIAFAKELIEKGIVFHPDDDFKTYINLETSEPSFSIEEAERINDLMNQCHIVCKQNKMSIYDLMNEVFLTETGMDKYIPLPSSCI